MIEDLDLIPNPVNCWHCNQPMILLLTYLSRSKIAHRCSNCQIKLFSYLFEKEWLIESLNFPYQEFELVHYFGHIHDYNSPQPRTYLKSFSLNSGNIDIIWDLPNDLIFQPINDIINKIKFYSIFS